MILENLASYECICLQWWIFNL